MPKKNVKSFDGLLPQDGDTEEVAKTMRLRRAPRQERAQQTVKTILEVANAEIQRDGLDRLTTNKVAAAAGLGVGTVYGYFPNKEAIVSALMSQWMADIYAFVEGLHPKAGGAGNVFSYLAESMDGAVGMYERQPGLGALLTMMPAIPALWEEMRRHDEKVVLSIASALASFVPGAPAADVDAVARCVFLTIHEVAMAVVVDAEGDRGRMLMYMRTAIFAMASQLAVRAAGAE